MRQESNAEALKEAAKGRAVLWLLCHYPETRETEERGAQAHALHEQLGILIWLFGSRMACYPLHTEQLIKTELLKRGIKEEGIVCSAEIEGIKESFDTVQEAFNVITAAKRQGITTIVCVSNAPVMANQVPAST